MGKNIELQKTILITGGSGRIGKDLAYCLLEKGYNVLLGDQNKIKLNKIKKNLNSKNLEIFTADLTKKKEIEKFIRFGIKRFKKIHGAVHCSYPKSKKWGTRFENLEERFLNEDLKLQLGGTIIFSQRIINQFIKQKEGNLVLISSIQGILPPKFEHYKNLNMISPIEYSAIKSGIIAITKYLSKYYRNKNIRVNCVSPGGIKDNQSKTFVKRYKQSCNSKGLLHENDITKLILFLLSNDSEYINGQNLIIDDGWSL